ncbi:MAG: hypothetical protein WCK35_30240, partial [Chloroflexota bacterium]
KLLSIVINISLSKTLSGSYIRIIGTVTSEVDLFFGRTKDSVTITFVAVLYFDYRSDDLLDPQGCAMG